MFPRLFHSLALRALPFRFSKFTYYELIVMEKISNAQRHIAKKKKTKVKDWKMLQLRATGSTERQKAALQVDGNVLGNALAIAEH